MRLKGLSTLALLCSIIFLLGSIIYLVVEAFSQSLWFGIRSLAACILPALVLFYLNTFTRIFNIKTYNRNFNLFVVYGLWTLFILVVGSVWEFEPVPLLEILFSFTLTSILFRIKKHSEGQKLASSCYGVLTGLLVYISIFGLLNLK
jgi:hypothetical protein